MDYVAIADRDVHLHDPRELHHQVHLEPGPQGHRRSSTRCTAIVVGLVALVLSDLMRLQIGFPGQLLASSRPALLQFVTMHGMIMVIYLLTALFLGGFGNYLIPLMVRRARHGVPVHEHAELLGLPACR